MPPPEDSCAPSSLLRNTDHGESTLIAWEKTIQNWEFGWIISGGTDLLNAGVLFDVMGSFGDACTRGLVSPGDTCINLFSMSGWSDCREVMLDLGTIRLFVVSRMSDLL